MSDDDLGEYATARKAMDEVRVRLAAEEQLHFDSLLASVSGRWLLRRLIIAGGALSAESPSGNSWDMYNHGRRQLVMAEIVAKIVEFHGYKALDTILQEERP